MRQQTRPLKEPAEKVVQDIRRATRKHYSAEEKIRIVLEGLRGEDSIAILPAKMLPIALLMSSSYLSSTHHFALNSVI